MDSKMMRAAAIFCVLATLTCQAQSTRISADQKWIASIDHGQLSIASVSGSDSSLPFGAERVGWQQLWSPAEDTLAVMQNEAVYTLSEKDRWLHRLEPVGGSVPQVGLRSAPTLPHCSYFCSAPSTT